MADHPAGFRQYRWHDTSRNRPVWGNLWYPASAGSTEMPRSYGLSMGSSATEAPVLASDAPLPLVVLSHGAGGSAGNYGWLGESLARDGFIVLGVSHYGESMAYGPETVDPAVFAQLWLRPPDCSFALDRLLAEPAFAGRIDATRVAAAGHSSGGATAIALAGGILDAAALGAYCRSDAGAADRGCDYARTAVAMPALPAAAGASWRDTRVRAVVALDPAAGPGHDRAALAGVTVPVLVVGSKDNDFLPFAHHAARYAELLPQATLVTLDGGEGHFVYLDVCSADIAANGVPLCRDRPGVDRRTVHAKLARRIADFLRLVLA